MLSKSLKTLLGFSLLGFVAVWMGCSSDTSPVAPQAAGKTHLTLTSSTDSDGDGIPDADSTPTYVTFADSSLERAVRTALGALVGGDPTSSLTDPTVPPLRPTDLATLTKLYASGRGITSLVGLEHATNLDTLHLSGNSITDLSPLAGLTNLKQLFLIRSGIADVTPLSGLINLEELRLYANYKIPDVSPLAGLTNLKKLGVGGNPLDGDLSPLTGLTKLEWLKVNGIGLTDAKLSSFFKEDHLTKLEWLNVSGNPISDLSPLTCLPKLDKLFLRNLVPNRIDTTNVHLSYLIDKGVTVEW